MAIPTASIMLLIPFPLNSNWLIDLESLRQIKSSSLSIYLINIIYLLSDLVFISDRFKYLSVFEFSINWQTICTP